MGYGTEKKGKEVLMTIPVVYQREYSIRHAQPTKKSIEVTFPFDVIEAKAGSLGLTVNEFISKYNVVARFNSLDDVRYSFKEKPDKKQ